MKRILFVDDEAGELDRLRVEFAGFPAGWRMEFVQDSAAAATRLDEAAWDAVVTDLEMPRMDGIQLLEEVQKRCPQALRMVVSSAVDREDILRALQVAHQHFRKADELPMLGEALQRGFALEDKLQRPEVRDMVAQLDFLPSLPLLYQKLLAELSRENPSLIDIGRLISQDIGLCTRLLQIVNSTFFGLQRNLSSVDEAVAYLGLETVKALALSVKVFNQFDPACCRELPLEPLWEHSMLTGQKVREITRRIHRPTSELDQAYTAGLLHDVGKLVLLQNLPKDYRGALEKARNNQMPLWQAELEILGTTHAEVGAFLLSTWGLPQPVVEGVAFHHRPGESAGQGFTTVSAVHLADGLVHMLNPSPLLTGGSHWDWEYLERTGLKKEFESWPEFH
jgi:HD-like signal output (HDOD) protein